MKFILTGPVFRRRRGTFAGLLVAQSRGGAGWGEAGGIPTHGQGPGTLNLPYPGRSPAGPGAGPKGLQEGWVWTPPQPDPLGPGT